MSLLHHKIVNLWLTPNILTVAYNRAMIVLLDLNYTLVANSRDTMHFGGGVH